MAVSNRGVRRVNMSLVVLVASLPAFSLSAVDSMPNPRASVFADSGRSDTVGSESVGAIQLKRVAELEKIIVGQASEQLPVGSDVDIANVLAVLGTFTTKQKIFRKYVLVEPDLSDSTIMEIARQLHTLEPETWFYLMDSDSDFDQMLAALPETEDGNLENWPSDYIEAHYVARTFEEIRGDGKGDTIRAWLVEGGPSRADLVEDI